MCCIARQKDASLAIRHRLPGVVRKTGGPAQAVHAVVGAVGGDECLADVPQGGLAGVLDLGFGQDDHNPISALGRADPAAWTKAELRLLDHLDLGHEPARRRIPPGELDTGRLSDHTAAPVAAHQIVRPDRRAVGQRDVDAAVVLGEPCHLTFARGRHAELLDPGSQQTFGLDLREGEPVVVAGWEITDIQGDSAESLDLHRLPLSEKPIRDAALIEHLDGARVQTAGACAVGIRTGAWFNDDGIDLRQCQLRSQHHSCRTASGNHHRVLGHTPPSLFVRTCFGRRVWSTRPGLAASPWSASMFKGTEVGSGRDHALRRHDVLRCRSGRKLSRGARRSPEQ